MPDIITTFSNAGSRNDVRMRVINAFSREEPGRGRGELVSRYDYYVETLSTGNHIILRRPASRYKGFDFVIRVENTNFNTTGRHRYTPKHIDVQRDFEQKRQENPELYAVLYQCLQRTYDCEEIQDNWFSNLIFNIGYPCDTLIKITKWLFIEQDIRFWNYSGRGMFIDCFPTP